MRLKNLHEMTINVHSEQTDEKVKSLFNFIDTTGVTVGDIDNAEITKASTNDVIVYGVKVNGVLTTAATFKEVDGNLQLYIIHTLKQFRGHNDAFKLLWFIKDKEQKSIIDYGAQTEDGIRFTKRLALSKRFDVFWYNNRTKERIPYDPNKDSFENTPFRSHTQRTNWRILVEKSSEQTFPLFHSDFTFFGNPHNIF